MGKKQGVLNTQLEVNASQIGVSDSTTKTVQIRTDSAKKRSDVLDKKYDVIRTKVTIAHDTLYVSSDIPGKVDTVANKTLAKLIHEADSSKVAHKVERFTTDSLVASLRHDITLRDERISLLKSRGTSRLSHGIQLGLGYCQTALSRTPCAYVGYGFQVRLP